MAEEKNLIEITHISKKFGDLTVLKDISVKVKEKEVVVIIGPSGSGKSTLLRCINGLETPTTGSITFDGVPVNGEKNINEVRTEVGMVFQRFNLFPHMSVIQNLMLAPMKVRKISKKEAYDRGMQLLKKVGQHVVRVILEPLEVIGHAAILPLPAPQQFILPRPDCEHTVMLRRILTQVVDHGADSAAFSMPVRDFVIQRELLDKRPRPVQFLNRHTCTGRCPCVQKYIEFLVGHLGQVF